MVLTEGELKSFYMIINLDIDNVIKRRLQDMGLTLGTSVKVMSFYSDNAMILNVRGSRVVVGNDVASKITVEPIVCPYKKKSNGHGKGHFRGQGKKRRRCEACR